MRLCFLAIFIPLCSLSAAQCARDNCLRAIAASAFGRSGTADCSRYLAVTVFEPATATKLVTLPTTVLITSTLTVETGALPSLAATTPNNVPQPPSVLKRQVLPPQSIPVYASACTLFARYSSACSCLGVTAPTFTATTTAVTESRTVLSSIVSTVIITAVVGNTAQGIGSVVTLGTGSVGSLLFSSVTSATAPGNTMTGTVGKLTVTTGTFVSILAPPSSMAAMSTSSLSNTSSLSSVAPDRVTSNLIVSDALTTQTSSQGNLGTNGTRSASNVFTTEGTGSTLSSIPSRTTAMSSGVITSSSSFQTQISSGSLPLESAPSLDSTLSSSFSSLLTSLSSRSSLDTSSPSSENSTPTSPPTDTTGDVSFSSTLEISGTQVVTSSYAATPTSNIERTLYKFTIIPIAGFIPPAPTSLTNT